MSKLIKKYDTVTGKNLIGKLGSNIDSTLADISVSHTYDSGTDTITLDLKRVEFGGLLNDTTGYEVWVDTEYIQKTYKDKIFGSTDLYYEHLSSDEHPVGCDYPYIVDGLTGNNLNKVIHGDDDYYFVVRAEASWSKDAGDNSLGYDFTSTDLYLQLLTSIYTNLSGTVITDGAYTNFESPVKVWSKKLSYVSGDTLTLDETFIIELPSAIFACLNFSLDNDTLFDDECYAIANHSRFFTRLTVKKYPKTSWWRRFELVPSDMDGNPIKQAFIFTSDTDGLPFVGYYEVDFYCEVVEELTAGDMNGNLLSPQILQIRGSGESFFHIDKSGRFVGVAPPNNDKFMNFSLQGSAITYVTGSTIPERNIEYKVTLPNGTQKQLTSGYCHVRYIGEHEGILRK